MTPCGLVNCKVLGPQGPSLTNRMSELLTYGSVGGGGSNPAPYPAGNGAVALKFHLKHFELAVPECERSAAERP